MTEFNSEEEMTEQLSLYFEGLGELSEQDQEYMKKKYAHVKEHLEEIFSYNVTGEKTMILRTIPLVFKKIGMKYVYNMAASANTATITNLGNIQVAPEYEEYVDHFSVILSRSKGQNLKMCLCSYNGMLTSTISSVMKDTKLQKAFYRYLVANDIPVTIESNGVYYE